MTRPGSSSSWPITTLLGRRAGDRQGDLSLCRRVRHPPFRPGRRRVRRDHQPPARVRESVPKAAAVHGLETSVIILSPTRGDQGRRVRQALNIAIDRQALADSLFGGYALRARASSSARRPSASTAAQAYPYDLEKAKALIKEAGAEGKTITLVGNAGRWLKDRELIEAVGADLDRGRPQGRLQDRRVRPVPDAALRPETGPMRSSWSNSNELLDADRPISRRYYFRQRLRPPTATRT